MAVSLKPLSEQTLVITGGIERHWGGDGGWLRLPR